MAAGLVSNQQGGTFEVTGGYAINLLAFQTSAMPKLNTSTRIVVSQICLYRFLSLRSRSRLNFKNQKSLGRNPYSNFLQLIIQGT